MKQKLFCLHVRFAGMRISGVAAHKKKTNETVMRTESGNAA